MNTEDTARFVRLRVDVVLEIEDSDAVTAEALRRIDGHPGIAEAERAQARSVVTEDTAEAFAYLVDPFDLVSAVPGVELQQASWSSELIDFDPDSPEWDLGDDDEGSEGGIG